MTQVDDNQQRNAEAFRQLHTAGTFVLPNAWDALSAALIAEAGASAVATTSAAVSWALGRPDGQHLTRDEAVDQIRRITRVVDIPVSADIEGGYGTAPDDVAATVAAVIAAGAIGINLEDSRASDGTLFDSGEQAERITAARRAAVDCGLPALVVNARTDVYLFEIGAPEQRLDDVLERAQAYAVAGADSLFVPGLLDLATLRELTTKVDLPVNVMVGSGAPSVAALAAAGVRRISAGPAIALAAYGQARLAAAELLAGGLSDESALSFGAAQALSAGPEGGRS